MFSNFPPLPPKNHALYEIVMEKNCGARQATDDYIIQHTHVACWITKATDTLRIRNTYSFPTATLVTRMHLSVILYVHCLCVILLIPSTQQ